MRRYDKQKAAVWERKLTVVLGFLFGITLMLFAVWAVTLYIDWAEVDDCLDKGGTYDYDEGRCDLETNHARNGDIPDLID